MAVNWTQAFNRLWEIVNGEVYLKGSVFLNLAREVDDSIPFYNNYIKERSERGMSTSRRDYYWDVIEQMKEDQKMEFFENMIHFLESTTLTKLPRLKSLFESESPVIRKKVIPSSTLPDNMYRDVLETLYNYYRNMEQKPSMFQGRDEEALRDLGLAMLESRYESAAATAEAFNRAGKTDIIIKGVNGENLFIAECKIWRGKVSCIEIICKQSVIPLYEAVFPSVG